MSERYWVVWVGGEDPRVVEAPNAHAAAIAGSNLLGYSEANVRVSEVSSPGTFRVSQQAQVVDPLRGADGVEVE